MPHLIDVISSSIAMILQCATLITVIYGFVKFTQKPTVDLDTRVTTLERWREKAEQRLQDGTLHFQANDESNRVTQSALVAIMDAMSQMDTVPPEARAEIKQRKKELMDYLTDR